MAADRNVEVVGGAGIDRRRQIVGKVGVVEVILVRTDGHRVDTGRCQIDHHEGVVGRAAADVDGIAGQPRRSVLVDAKAGSSGPGQRQGGRRSKSVRAQLRLPLVIRKTEYGGRRHQDRNPLVIDPFADAGIVDVEGRTHLATAARGRGREAGEPVGRSRRRIAGNADVQGE